MPEHSPVQTEVGEPILHHDHHVADREEEGSYLQGLWEQRDTAAGPAGKGWGHTEPQQSCLFPAAQPWQAHCGPHLHLYIGVREVVLRRQFAVVIDEVVQDGWAEDGLQEEG